MRCLKSNWHEMGHWVLTGTAVLWDDSVHWTEVNQIGHDGISRSARLRRGWDVHLRMLIRVVYWLVIIVVQQHWCVVQFGLTMRRLCRMHLSRLHLLLLMMLLHRCVARSKVTVFAQFHIILKCTVGILTIRCDRSHGCGVHIFGGCCIWHHDTIAWHVRVWFVEQRVGYQLIQFEDRFRWLWCAGHGWQCVTFVAQIIFGAQQNFIKITLRWSQWKFRWFAWIESKNFD